ncbi:MAG: TetR/AcrR family transcriptional regulator [Anaerolineae bacterium]
MDAKPTNRQAHRTQMALKTAFIELLQELNYEAITIENIADRANVGRSTFYRHYNSKPDLLLSWHEDIFKGLDLGHYTPLQWLSDEPPAQLTAFFERMRNSRMPLHNFGKDGAYVLRRIGGIFTRQIEVNLGQSFPDKKIDIPLGLVAQSIAGLYVWIFQWWITEHPPYTAEQMAVYTHRMMRGIISTATNREGHTTD